MKKFMLLLLFLLVVSSGNVTATTTGSYHAGSPQPSTLAVYYADNWSASGQWQLDENNFPPGAQITKVKVEWETVSSLSYQSYRGLNLILFNQKQKVKLQKKPGAQSAISKKFSGQSITETWGLKYKVNQLQLEGNYLGLTPKLIIYYRVAR